MALAMTANVSMRLVIEDLADWRNSPNTNLSNNLIGEYERKMESI